jgi:protein tyrosine/serine phosphatase
VKPLFRKDEESSLEQGKRRKRRAVAAVIGAGLLIGGLYYTFVQYCLPNFHTMRPGVLYRSGQPRGLGLEWVKLRGIRTLINLRSPDSDGTPQEKAFAEKNGLNFYNLHIGSSLEAIRETVERFLEIVDDPTHYPILVHCSRGKERAGVLSAVFRMEYDRWSNEEALEETYRLGLERGGMPVAEEFIRAYKPRWRSNRAAPGTPGKPLPEVPWRE